MDRFYHLCSFSFSNTIYIGISFLVLSRESLKKYLPADTMQAHPTKSQGIPTSITQYSSHKNALYVNIIVSISQTFTAKRSLGGLLKSQHIIVDGGDANGHNRVVLPRNLCIRAPHLRILFRILSISFMILENMISNIARGTTDPGIDSH